MADIDDNAPPRPDGNRRRGGAGERGAGARAAGGERPASPLQVDEAANRIVIDFAAARRGRREGAGDRPSPGREPRARAGMAGPGRRQAGGTLPTTPVEETPVAAQPDGSSFADIPTIPLDPGPQEFGRDLDAEVYIPAEHGERGGKRDRPKRRRQRSISNPFGRIEKGERPKGHAPIPKWQKIVMGVCSVAIVGILYWVLGTGTTKLPGWDQGVLVRTQIEFLDQNLRLPYAPQSVTWQLMTDEEQSTYGRARNRLIAVMLFTPEQAAELIANALPMPQPDNHQAIETERWFPDEVRDLMSDVDSETTVYDAGAFYDGVFQRGIMLRLGETGYIVAKLFDY
jgi:hypothetical protein